MSGASELAGAGEGAPYALLPSKIHVPARMADAVAREGVRAKLDRCLSCALTTVVASAGYGKTTAVAGLAASLRDLPEPPVVAWYAVAAEDAPARMFWRYVSAALAAADPALADLLDGACPQDVPDAQRRLVDAVLLALGALSRDVVLVLEDFHLVQDDPVVAEGFRRLLANLPQNAHLVVTSRRPLAQPLSKLRVSGRLSEVGEADLRFTPEQQASFFSHGASGAPGDADLARLGELTRGWPCGCRLVAMLGASGEGPQAYGRAREGMGDYLFEEVVCNLPADVRSFLARTALVDSFCPSLAAAMTGRTPGETRALAESLAAGDLFVERIGVESGESWYRYHALLRDALAAHPGELGERGASEALGAACAWYARAGYLDQAAELLARQRDWAGLRALIQHNWKALYMSDAHHALVRWASLMPQAEVLASPFVCAVLAMPYAAGGQMERADACVMQAVMRLKDDEDFLFALCMVEKAFLASFKADFASMRHYAERALRYLPEEEFYLRGMMLQVQASSWSVEDPPRTRQLLLEAVGTQSGLGNKNLACSALGNLALACAGLGHMDEAALYAGRALRLYAPDERTRKPMLAYSHLALAMADYERADDAAALADLDAFERLLERQPGSPEIVAQGLALRAKVCARQGREGEARELFGRALDASPEGACLAFPSASLARPCAGAYVATARAHLAAPEGVRTHVLVFDVLVLACERPLLAQAQAACELARSVRAEEPLARIHALVAASVLSERAAATERACDLLAEACGLAVASGLTAAVRENAAELAGAAARLAPCVRDAAVAAFLRETFGHRGAGEAAPAAAGDASAQLTERELDVMRLVAAGMTLAEAAEQMVVSRETVKKHLANIYAKLGVHSKMQAVALLRERGLL